MVAGSTGVFPLLILKCSCGSLTLPVLPTVDNISLYSMPKNIEEPKNENSNKNSNNNKKNNKKIIIEESDSSDEDDEDESSEEIINKPNPFSILNSKK